MNGEASRPFNLSPDEMLDLPPDGFIDAWYMNHYAEASYRGAAGLVQNRMHSSLERGLGRAVRFPQVLEVGGNVGEHLNYVHHSFGRYVLSDIADRRTMHDQQRLAKRDVDFIEASAENLPFATAAFDRALMTCVLHHLDDPESALMEMRRVVRRGGVVDVFLPSDPGMAFRFAKRLGPIRKASRHGLREVKALMDARDHRNHVASLITLAKHTFRNDATTLRSYPVPGMPWDLSLWTCIRVVRDG